MSAAPSLLVLVREYGYERREEPFTLSAGGTSHDYVDLRRAVASGAHLRIAAEAIIGAIDKAGVGFDAIGGMTMGADPVAHAVALISGHSWFSVRKAEKAHGSRRRIEGGELGPGVRTIVFEDTVSTGRSLLEALDVVTDTGAEITLACTLLDRGDVAASELELRGVPYVALLSYRDLDIAPLGSAPLGSAPLGSAPLGSAPLNTTPIRD